LNHSNDYDREKDKEDVFSNEMLFEVVESALNVEKEMMQSYLVAADRIHDNEVLKLRLREFAEGNAKRSTQLEDVLNQLQ
jgi:hypothetical protein